MSSFSNPHYMYLFEMKNGKKKLAYPIKHFMEGYYVFAQLKMKPATSKELEANLKVSEDVIRHLLVLME